MTSVPFASVDRLSPFLMRFSLVARVFFAGHICGISPDHSTSTSGHLHVLRSGTLRITDKSGKQTTVSEPTVLLFPRPEEHRFESAGADIVCALGGFWWEHAQFTC